MAQNTDVRIDKLNIKGLITNEPFSREAATARESGCCKTGCCESITSNTRK